MKKLLLLAAALTAGIAVNALTYNVTVPAGTNACYIAGSMNGWVQTEMTKVDATHYTIDLASATEADQYKYCSGPDWQYVEKDATGGEMANRTYNANDVVAQWAAIYTPPTGGEGEGVTYSIKHGWKDGQDTSWSYKDLTDNGNGTYSIRDIYGGTGCNWKSTTTSEKWIAKPTLEGAPAVGDSAIFTLTSTVGDGAITITKIGSTGGGTTGGDDPQPGTTEYYLFGSINGANYGCEDDWETIGEYKFVDGKLSATFSAVSYVGVKTGDNSTWYMTDGWQGNTQSVTLYKTSLLDEDANKLLVPEGKIDFTLTENADGTLTLAYTATTTAIETVETIAIYAEQGRICGADNMRIYSISGMDVTELNGQLNNGIYIVKANGTTHKIAVK